MFYSTLLKQSETPFVRLCVLGHPAHGGECGCISGGRLAAQETRPTLAQEPIDHGRCGIVDNRTA